MIWSVSEIRISLAVFLLKSLKKMCLPMLLGGQTEIQKHFGCPA